MKIKLFNRFNCTYCGSPCDTRDHVIPVSREYTSRKNAKTNIRNTVPSCRECNTMLGSLLFLTIGDRASYLYTLYKGRFKKLLFMPDWSIEDLDGLKGRLKQSVRNSVKKKERAKERIKHIELVIALCPTIQEVWEIINEDNLEEDKIVVGNENLEVSR